MLVTFERPCPNTNAIGVKRFYNLCDGYTLPYDDQLQVCISILNNIQDGLKNEKQCKKLERIAQDIQKLLEG